MHIDFKWKGSTGNLFVFGLRVDIKAVQLMYSNSINMRISTVKPISW